VPHSVILLILLKQMVALLLTALYFFYISSYDLLTELILLTAVTIMKIWRR